MKRSVELRGTGNGDGKSGPILSISICDWNFWTKSFSLLNEWLRRITSADFSEEGQFK